MERLKELNRLRELVELKDDVRAFYTWAEQKYPDGPKEHGIELLLFDLESTLQSLNKLINKRHEDSKQSK